jgi:hypothetical protein
MHLRLGVAILWSASLSRDDVRRSPKAREGWSFEKRTNFVCSAIDFVRAAHPGVAWHVDLNAIASSDNKRRRDHHRLKRRFFRSIDAANSRAIKKQDPTGRPLHQAIDTVRHCKSSQMIVPNYGSERDTRSHLDRHLSVLAEVWLLSGQPRLGEFEGSNESARRSIPQFRGEWLDLQ